MTKPAARREPPGGPRAATRAAPPRLASGDRKWALQYDTGTEHPPQLAGYAEHARRNIAFKAPILFCFPPAASPASSTNANAARWTRSADDQARFPQCPGWRFPQRAANADRNAT